MKKQSTIVAPLFRRQKFELLNNKEMHPRNIYNSPPDFSELAIKYPEFLKISKLDINGKVRIDFKDQNTIRILTKCLLHKDFGLNVDIPPNRLVPTVPLRLNYLLWLEDILNAANITSNIYGIDIGTGACCIYPLLAAVKFKWKMMATEVNENSVNMAYRNVRQNKLEDRITVKKVNNDNLILHCLETNGGTLDFADFCMCNPPFYASAEDMDISRTPRRNPPNNARTGILQEVITEGGEVEFVKKLFKESLQLKEKIKIYTTMLGHKSSLIPLLKMIKYSGVTQVCHTNFIQGKTMRWGLAWSFIDSTNLNSIDIGNKSKNKLKKCLSFEIPPLEGLEYKVKDVSYKIFQIFKQLELKYSVLQNKEVICTLEVRAFRNTWTNQRRKRREQLKLKKTISEIVNDATSDRLAVPIESNSRTNMINDNLNLSTQNYSRVQEINIESLNSVVESHKIELKKDKEILTIKAKRKVECDADLDVKKIKLDGDNHSNNVQKLNKNDFNVPEAASSNLEQDNFLSMAVCIRLHGNSIVLEMGYISGKAGKDGVHQIVQHIKNNWK